MSKKYKKLLSVLLYTTIILSLCSCGKKEESSEIIENVDIEAEKIDLSHIEVNLKTDNTSQNLFENIINESKDGSQTVLRKGNDGIAINGFSFYNSSSYINYPTFALGTTEKESAIIFDCKGFENLLIYSSSMTTNRTITAFNPETGETKEFVSPASSELQKNKKLLKLRELGVDSTKFEGILVFANNIGTEIDISGWNQIGFYATDEGNATLITCAALTNKLTLSDDTISIPTEKPKEEIEVRFLEETNTWDIQKNCKPFTVEPCNVYSDEYINISLKNSELYLASSNDGINFLTEKETALDFIRLIFDVENNGNNIENIEIDYITINGYNFTRNQIYSNYTIYNKEKNQISITIHSYPLSMAGITEVETIKLSNISYSINQNGESIEKEYIDTEEIKTSLYKGGIQSLEKPEVILYDENDVKIYLLKATNIKYSSADKNGSLVLPIVVENNSEKFLRTSCYDISVNGKRISNVPQPNHAFYDIGEDMQGNTKKIAFIECYDMQFENLGITVTEDLDLNFSLYLTKHENFKEGSINEEIVVEVPTIHLVY